MRMSINRWSEGLVRASRVLVLSIRSLLEIIQRSGLRYKLGRNRRRCLSALPAALNHHSKRDLRIVSGREPDKPRVGRDCHLGVLVTGFVYVIDQRVSLSIVGINIAVRRSCLAS